MGTEKKNRLYYNANDLEPETVEGNVIRYVYTASNMQTVEYHFPPNKTFPPHKHDQHEQIGYLVKGKMGFKIGDEEKILLPGDYYHAPRGAMHNAWTLDGPAVLLDFFSPPREDLIK